MLRFIKLDIKGAKVELQKLLSSWKNNTPKGWKYDKTKSQDMVMNALYLEDEEWAIFKTPKKLYDSSVCVLLEEDTLRVVNITSGEYFYLGKERYNEVLLAFYREFVEHNSLDLLKVHISLANQSLDELVNEDTASKLRKWEMCCNRSNGGIIQPFDREMWFDFIITAVRTHSEIDMDILEQWLVEEQKWPGIEDEDSRTSRVLMYFEYGRDLVEYYEKNIHK